MTYVEFLRARKVVTVFTIIVAVCVALTLIGVYASAGDMNVSGDGGASVHVSTSAHATVHRNFRDAIAADFAAKHTTVPFSAFVFIALFAATIAGSIFGAGLCRERDYVALAWTKPVSRARQALAYLGVDALGMFAVFAVVLVLGCCLTLWAIGIFGYLRVDPIVWQMLPLSIGISFAYYGMVRAVSVGFPGRGGAIAGGSWPIAYLLIGLTALPLPALMHGALILVNFLNPLAYLTGFNETGVMSTVLWSNPDLRTALVWVLAVATNAVAIVLYQRAEA